MRIMMQTRETTSYEIQIHGVLGAHWETWIDGDLDIIREGGTVTTIVARVPDQAALRGLANRLWDLNLTIIYMQRIWPADLDSMEEGGHED